MLTCGAQAIIRTARLTDYQRYAAGGTVPGTYIIACCDWCDSNFHPEKRSDKECSASLECKGKKWGENLLARNP